MLVATAASAGQPPPVQIWYRGSNGCPEAGDFLRRLAALGFDGNRVLSEDVQLAFGERLLVQLAAFCRGVMG